MRSPLIHVTAALLQNSEDHILIARRKQGQRLAYKWEFPGGKQEPGETPQECLRRELWEELRLQVAVGPFFADSTYTYDFATIHLSAYWAYLVSGKPQLTVHDQLAWVRPSDLSNYAFAPADIPIIAKLC